MCYIVTVCVTLLLCVLHCHCVCYIVTVCVTLLLCVLHYYLDVREGKLDVIYQLSEGLVLYNILLYVVEDLEGLLYYLVQSKLMF